VPRMSQTFRWYADRSEVVTRKDLPQDARGIVEWHRRMNRVFGSGDAARPWIDSLAELGGQRLRELADEFGADYVVTSPSPPLPLKRVGPITRTSVIYRLPRPSQPDGL